MLDGSVAMIEAMVSLMGGLGFDKEPAFLSGLHHAQTIPHRLVCWPESIRKRLVFKKSYGLQECAPMLVIVVVNDRGYPIDILVIKHFEVWAGVDNHPREDLRHLLYISPDPGLDVGRFILDDLSVSDTEMAAQEGGCKLGNQLLFAVIRGTKMGYSGDFFSVQSSFVTGPMARSWKNVE